MGFLRRIHRPTPIFIKLRGAELNVAYMRNAKIAAESLRMNVADSDNLLVDSTIDSTNQSRKSTHRMISLSK